MSGSVDPIHPEVISSLEIALDDAFNDERTSNGVFPGVGVFPF